jgi:FkbM family methyltransferase
LQIFYANFIPSGGVIFDVGAHVGNRTQVFLDFADSVVALEPQPIFNKFLKWLFRQEPRVTVLANAAGANGNTSRLLLSPNAPTVSSMAMDWVTQVQAEDPGFSWVRWDESIEVQVTTLDDLIAHFGLPTFCKIDVEGYEFEVLKGLSQPIPILSIEFITSALNHTWPCLDKIESLGPYEFNLAYLENKSLELQAWVEKTGIIQHLKNIPASITSGDIYARVRP